MAVVDELVTILGIRLAPDAVAKLQSFKQHIATASQAAMGFGLALTGAATAAGFLGKGILDQAGRLDKLSRQTGIGTDTLQEFQFAAVQMGASADAVTGDLVNFQKTMSSPIPGQFNKTLAMFGVSARDASGALRTTDQVLTDMAARFQGMSPQLAAQWASKLGISDDTLLLLRQGRDGLTALREEAQRLGGIIPIEALRRASEFRERMRELNFILRGLISTAVLGALPAFQKIVHMFRTFVELNRSWIMLGIEALLSGIVLGLQRVFSVLSQLASGVSPVLDFFRNLLPEITKLQLVTHLVTGAVVALLAALAPFLLKVAGIGIVIAGLSVVLEDFLTHLEGGRSVVGLFANEFTQRWPEIVALVGALGVFFREVLVAGLKVAWEAVKALASVFVSAVAAILDSWNFWIGQFRDSATVFGGVAAMLVKALQTVASVALSIGAAFSDAFGTAVSAAQQFIAVGRTVGDVLSAAFNKVSGPLNALQGVFGFLGKAFGAVSGAQAPAQSVFGSQQIGIAGAGRGGQSPVGGNQQTYYNDNRDVHIQVVTSDPVQASQHIADALGTSMSVNTNTPGQFAPRAF